MRWAAIVLLLLLGAAGQLEAAIRARVTMSDNRVIMADDIRFKKTTQEYVLTVKNSEMPLPKAQVKKVEAEKPPKYDQAAQMVRTGMLDAAIPVLEEMASEYFMLTPWDMMSLDLLGYVYSKKDDAQKAAATYKKLFANAVPDAITPDMQRRYWGSLIAISDTGTLTKELNEAIAKGTRENAANAHIARADLAKKQGNKVDALLDYLRVVMLYDQVKPVQAEALYKTAQCLEEIRDPRAEDWRRKLMQDWPQSEWAQKK
jgi:tetratricopeptide (TPR) repeat protein